MNIPIVAGVISTCLFVVSVLPMLVKAWRTKDLSSYSLGNIATNNVANLIYAVYVANLPPGPIWLLHSFYLVATALMLFWYLRYQRSPDAAPARNGRAASPSPLQQNLTEQELLA